ncbi:MAG TPA: hypothetical protein VGV85_04850 [Longimicrobiaceae bacterium]|nr:hypothetical protein [Longimicrobiaceae bacterium]
MVGTTHGPASADRSLSLKKIADELLSDEAGDDRLAAAAAGLYALCSSIAGIDEDSGHAGDSDGTRLPSGEALSPRDAARCVLDFRRTSRFLRGLQAAILEARARFPDGATEILYAGCGPFAPLALPLTTRFSPAEIRFTLLDAHERSLDAARLIFQALGKGAFVRDYVRCDAASYEHDAPHALHLVVVEAMQAALEKEPQVAITMNLAPQLRPGGTFIPERITVDCCLCDPAREFPAPPAGAGAADSLPPGAGGRARVHLGRVLDLTARGFRGLPASGGGDEQHGSSAGPKLLLRVPGELDGEFGLMLLTSITVFDCIALDEGESGLTCPRILYDAGTMRGGETMEFEYRLGDEPGFRYRPL